VDDSTAAGARQRSQVGTIQPDDIERDIGRRPRAAEEIVKLRSAGFVGSDHLAVNYRIVDVELGRQRAGEHIEAAQQVPIARDQAVVSGLDVIERAEAVVFDIEEPIGAIERLLTPSRRDRLHAWKGHSMGYAIAHVADDLVQLPDQRFGLHIIEFEVRHTPDYGVVSSASPRRPWSYLNRRSSATLSCHDLKAKSRPGEVSLAHKSALAFMTSSKAAFSAARSASL
jgi:hypothetical protein